MTKKLTILPKTKLGKWAILLFLSSWILFVIGSLLPSKIGLTGLEAVIQNPLQTIITIVMFIIGMIAPIMSLIAVIKQQERSILVILIIPTIVTNLLMMIGVILNVVLGMTL